MQNSSITTVAYNVYDNVMGQTATRRVIAFVNKFYRCLLFVTVVNDLMLVVAAYGLRLLIPIPNLLNIINTEGK